MNNRSPDIHKTNNKMVDVCPNMLITVLTINGPNTPVKGQIV